MVVASRREGAAERKGPAPPLRSSNTSAAAGRVHGTSLTELLWVALWEAPSLPPRPANVDSHLAERLGTDQKLTLLVLWAGRPLPAAGEWTDSAWIGWAHGLEGRRGVGSKCLVAAERAMILLGFRVWPKNLSVIK